jgi:prepilin-type N-terminal cleavage/methylation domain-containing protein
MKNNMFISNRARRGFTLLELLIVITIIAILSVSLVLVINPAETLKKSRDSQRISDLNTLKSAIGIYSTSTSTPYLAGSMSNAGCKTGGAGGTYGVGSKVYYSYPSDGRGAAITDTTLDGDTDPTAGQVVTANLGLTDGTGWLPINFDSLTSGSPISNLPIDPVNTVTSVSAVAGTDLVYRYACNSTSLTYELNAKLESVEFTTTNDKQGTDGGNNSSLYEVGTNLKILGAASDF